MGLRELLIVVAWLGMASSLMSQDWSSSRLKLGSIASSVSQGGNPARVGSQNTVTVDVNKGMPIDFDYSHVETERDPSQWTASVTPKRDVVYGAALSAQMNMIRSLGLTQVDLDDKFVLQFSKLKQARIANMQFEGGAFRKVRMTYFDAGPNVQVFNALWMPRYEYDVPMLGVDLISLGKSRVLSVVDMQPLYPDEDYSRRYIEREEINAIKAKYPDLQGKLSGKIYDDTSFFSKNMLFGRFTDESKVKSVVHAAHEEYLGAYHNMVRSALPNKDPAAMAAVKERQVAYDVYSAEKDPAVGLFDAYFGKAWSDEFVHSFLFGLSREGAEGQATEAKPPVHQFKLDGDGSGDSQGPHIIKS